MKVRYIMGCMTGTSLDGLDAVLVRVVGEGLSMRAEFVGMASQRLGELADTLGSFANGDAHPPLAYLLGARKLGELHADVCVRLAADCAEALASHPLDFIVAHGQTIWHAPRDPGGRLSWQLLDAWPIVRGLRVPVCYDLRQADLIAGGQGAPITPMADWVMYRSPRRRRAIVNLGGICNITELPLGGEPEHVRGGDVGPCNILIDGMVRRLFGQPFDQGGSLAATGRAQPQLLSHVLQRCAAAAAGAASLGREVYTEEFIEGIARQAGGISSPDVLATVVRAVAMIISGCARGTDPQMEVVLAGGGSRNGTLVQALRECIAPPRTVIMTDELGIPCDAREAMGFAVLGALSQDGIPITLPGVTGSVAPGRAGAWAYP